jgi:hypothetical protein
MNGVILALLLSSAVPAAGDTPLVPRTPALVGRPWKIALMPDLGELNGPVPSKQHIVDHGFVRDGRGGWQLWACIRGVKVGRILYRWEGTSLEQGPWPSKGVAARADRRFGEQVKDDGTETIQAPYFRKVGDTWYCFYNSAGVRYMTSTDGVTYTRPTDRNGTNLLGAPGGRDVMILEHDGTFYSYATVSELRDGKSRGYVIGSSSRDLKSWTNGVVVSEGGRGGPGVVGAESPFVQFLDGYFYLFRSSSLTGKTYVYRSTDPLKFNVNTDDGYVATLPVWAPEVIHDQGKWYISDLGKFQALLMHRLEWR